MKSMKQVFVCLVIALIQVTAMAQDIPPKSEKREELEFVNSGRSKKWLPDSIKVEMPDQKAVLIFQFKNIAQNIAVVDDFASHLAEWTTLISRSLPSTASPQIVTIRIKDEGVVELNLKDPVEKKTTIRVKDHDITELLPPGWELTIHFKDAVVRVYVASFKDLELLSKASLQPIKEKIQSEISEPPLHRKGLVSRMVFKDNKIGFYESKRVIAGDFLELNLGTGLGFFADKFYPQLSPVVSFQFGDRFHRLNYQFSFSYQTQFFTSRKTDGGYLTSPNSFLTASWSKNLNFKSGSPSWLGVGAGFLVRRSGSYYTGKTCKFFISKDIGSFKISPEVYLTNDFKSFQTGISLQFMF